MKRLMISVLLSALLVSSASAEFTKVGSSGAQFLKIAVGSRYQAMGEAAAATADDVYATFFNPAGLAEIGNGAISFTKVDYLLDIDLNYVGFAKYFDDVGVLGLSATMLSAGDQEITTLEQQDGTGEYYTASSYAVGVTYARQLNLRFSFGASLKYIAERIHNERAEGFAVDFGTLVYLGYRSLRLGMAISNMGPEMKFSGSDLIVQYYDEPDDDPTGPVSAELKTTPYDLPLLFRIGLAYDIDLGYKSVMTVAGELKHPNDNVQQGAFGVEYAFDDNFFLRGGYKLNYDEEGLTAGAGLATDLSKSTRLVIDYAWQDFGRLQSTQRFSVGFTF
ncbi:MAG: PorV/PorQ family protein [Candidatus Zixiibacteriota bacterium]|nr:MAG: PorV/PorQ family protein [candidate division Zixibacteria bacterium]